MRNPGTPHGGGRAAALPVRKPLTSAAAAALCALLVAGCGSSGSGSATTAASGARITLTVGDYGTFGYKEAGLFDEYMREHPGVTIVEHTVEQESDYYPALETHLASGSGLDDIQGIEVGRIAQVVKRQANQFVDLGKADGVDKSDFLPWKWQQATTSDGRTIGLGTDIGPMAICYRKDLFQQAGLPTDRDQVAKLWQGDWAKFVETGKEYQAKAPAGTFFTDSAGGLFNAVVSSGTTQYDNGSGQLDYKDSPTVRTAWNLATGAIRAGISAGLKQFDTPWYQAFANSRFATVACPSWMTAIVSDKSGSANKGKWGIAAAPAAGNWGGSFLAVPKAGKHQKEAEALAAWLTAPAQQAKVFTTVGNLPSNAKALSRPEVQNAELDYFGDTPTGQIYAATAQSIQPTVIGEWDGLVKDTLTNGALLSIEQHQSDPAKAWNEAVKEIDDKVGD
ncbi:extracellular solute-binding protein [Kitasatospora sp. RB6PN24]|uniref:ABC transporter substrate-binding protein n=1 Tax=Kitasatospora humi TaxID=2893891 RepID=UPI001E3A4BCA|nr:extracellular solute-binding protein [Kitasatospora humi]MCC9306517.1 extracellular solute-binding protein [Kitasatospora humi]